MGTDKLSVKERIALGIEGLTPVMQRMVPYVHVPIQDQGYLQGKREHCGSQPYRSRIVSVLPGFFCFCLHLTKN